MFGYMMHTSDDVLEDLMTHKNLEGRVPEADPTCVHLETVIDPGINDDMDQLYDDLIKETKEMGPIILSAMASGYISYLSYKGAFDSVRLDNVIGNALDGATKEVGGTLR